MGSTNWFYSSLVTLEFEEIDHASSPNLKMMSVEDVTHDNIPPSQPQWRADVGVDHQVFDCSSFDNWENFDQIHYVKSTRKWPPSAIIR